MAKKITVDKGAKIRKLGSKVAGWVVPVSLGAGLIFATVFAPNMAKSCNNNKRPDNSKDSDTNTIDTIHQDFESSFNTEPFYDEETVDFEDDSTMGDNTIEEPTSEIETSREESSEIIRPNPDITGRDTLPDETIADETTEETTEEIVVDLSDILATLTENIRETNNNSTISISSIENMFITKNNGEYNIELVLGGIIGKTPKAGYFTTPIKSTSEDAKKLYDALSKDVSIQEYLRLLNGTLNSNETVYGKSKGTSKMDVADPKTLVKRLVEIRRAEIANGTANPNELANLNKIALNTENVSVQAYDALCTNPDTFEYSSNVVLNFENYSYQFKITVKFDMQPTSVDVKNAFSEILNGTSTRAYTISTNYTNNATFAKLLDELENNNELTR